MEMDASGRVLLKSNLPCQGDCFVKGCPFIQKGEKAIHGDFQSIDSGNATNLGFRLFDDLSNIRSALVSLLGWESTSFSNSLLASDARIFKYFKQETKDDRVAESLKPGPELTGAGFGEFLRLLVVPALPRSEGKLRETFSLLKSLGVDGVLRRSHAGKLASSDLAVQVLSWKVDLSDSAFDEGL